MSKCLSSRIRQINYGILTSTPSVPSLNAVWNVNTLKSSYFVARVEILKLHIQNSVNILQPCVFCWSSLWLITSVQWRSWTIWVAECLGLGCRGCSAVVAHVGTPGQKNILLTGTHTFWLDSVNYEFCPRSKLLLCWLARCENLGFLVAFGANSR